LSSFLCKAYHYGGREIEVFPLHGYHLVSLALNVPGCVAASRLKELGARVTKVEPPTGDPLIRMSQQWYELLIQDMKTLRLDLKDPNEYLLLEQQLSDTDILLTSMRPAALERLGLGWQDLHGRFPRLCHVAFTGYPEPHENRPGHDLTYQAEAGLVTPPYMPNTLLADLAGVERAISAVLALLLARERGEGSAFLRVSLYEAGLVFASPIRYGLTIPGGILGGGNTGYNLFPARTGWLAVATLEGHFQEKLVRELGLQDGETMQDAFLGKTAEEWADWARVRDLPIVEVAVSHKNFE
jgi:alpha-methylacyl-CoA racemase